MGTKRVDGLLWRPSPFAEIGRYAVAAALVSTLTAGGIVLVSRVSDGAPPAEPNDAILVDLPPVLSSLAPRRDVAPGPPQQAMVAASAVPQAEATQTDKPLDDPKAIGGEILMPEKTAPPPLPPVSAAQAQDETGVSGSNPKPRQNESAASEAARARAAKDISLWQRSMLSRLEIAKSGMRPGGAYGTVEIVFSIDGAGRLLSSRIQRSSGVARLDRAGLLLIQRASPYPTPPVGLTPLELTFEVPIVFGRRSGSP